MNNSVITLSLWQLALAFVPVAITLVILFRWSFGTGNTLYALGRMLVQLLLIGYVLAWIFGAHNGLLILLVLAIMLLASSWIAMGTVKAHRRTLLLASLVSITIGGGLTLALITQLVLQMEPWYLPRYMIPLAGMVFANAMTAVSLAAEFIRRIGAWYGLGESQACGLPGGHDPGDQLPVCGGPGVPARDDDRPDPVRRIAADRSTLPDHGDVHDFCGFGIVRSIFSCVV